LQAVVRQVMSLCFARATRQPARNTSGQEIGPLVLDDFKWKRQEEASFLKKRSKKLLFVYFGDGTESSCDALN